MSVNLTEDQGPDYYAQAQALLQAGQALSYESFGHRAEAVRLQNELNGVANQIEAYAGAHEKQRNRIIDLQAQVKRFAEIIDEVRKALDETSADNDIFNYLDSDEQLFIEDFDIEKELEDCGCGANAS